MIKNLSPDKALWFAQTIAAARNKGIPDSKINADLKSKGKPFTVADIEAEASSWSNVGRTLLQGVSFGYGDEAIAGVRSAFGEPYDAALKDERQGLAEYSAMNPYKAMGLEVAGSLPTMAIPGLGQARAATLGGRLGKAALQGGAEGFVTGTGKGEGGLQDRLQSGAVGSAGGAVGGTGMKGVTELGGDLASKAWARSLGRSGSEQTARAAARDIATGGEGVEPVLERAANVSPTQAKSMVIGDLSDDLSASTSSLANRQANPGSNMMRSAMREREAGSGDRIMGTVKRLMRGGQNLSDNIIEEAQGLSAQMDAVAKPLYKAARDAVDLSPIRAQLAMWAKHGTIKAASKEARQLTEIGEKFDLANADLRTWDLVKRGLDTVYEKNLKPDGSASTVSRNAQKLKTELLELLDGVDTDGLYAKARAAYSGPASIKSAMDNGYDFFRTASAKKAAIGRNAIRNMSSTERDAFARGIAYSIKDMATEAGDTANIARNLTKGTRAEALKDLFPSEIEHGKFIRDITDELSMFETSGVTLRGSRTKLIDEALDNIDSKIGLGGVLTGGDLVTTVMNKIKGDATELTRNKIYKHLSDIFMTKLDDPAKVKKILKPDFIDKVYDSVNTLTTASIEKAGRKVGAVAGESNLKPLVIDIYNTPTGAPPKAPQR